MGHLSEAATALAEDPALRPLWDAARTRLRRRPPGSGYDAVRVPAGPEARGSLQRLLGPLPRGNRVAVDLDQLNRLLHDLVGAGLGEIVGHLHGAVVDVATERHHQAETRPALAALVAGHEAGRRHPGLSALVTGPRLRARTADPGLPLPGILDVFAALPASPPVGRDVLAALHLADSHALDDGEPAGRYVVAVLAALSDLETPSRAEARRGLLESFGILTDAVSSRVHTLNLPDVGWPGEPATLNLTNLTDPGRWREVDGLAVYACENPTVLQAAAYTYAAACRPMVCIDGNPSIAGQRLLADLAAAGATVRYHGDFDPGGLSIAATVFALHRAIRPWRYAADDYRAAIESGRWGRPLTGTPPATRWSPGLGPLITSTGVTVEEQHVLDSLLSDLDRAAPTSRPHGAKSWRSGIGLRDFRGSAR